MTRTRSAWQTIRSAALSIIVVLCLAFAVSSHPGDTTMGDDFPNQPTPQAVH